LTRFGPAKLTGEALRPHGIAQKIDAGGLHQERRMPDETDPDRAIVDPRRRAVGIGARDPFRPFRAPTGQLPAHNIANAARRRAMGIMEASAVEMIGHRPLVVAGEQRAGESGTEHDRRRSGDPRQQVATRWRHRLLHSGLAAAQLTA
jgi:hypothetical protein